MTFPVSEPTLALSAPETGVSAAYRKSHVTAPPTGESSGSESDGVVYPLNGVAYTVEPPGTIGTCSVYVPSAAEVVVTFGCRRCSSTSSDMLAHWAA